jgi:ABC-type nitrate/sulfonate/bicarbonate transport system substrate-binding protein
MTGFSMTRRAALATGTGALVTGKTVYAQSAPPEINTIRSTARSWLWLAEDWGNEGGFFREAGVRVVSNASGRGTNAAALAGSGTDILLGDPGEALRARGQGLPIKPFIATVNKYASHVVVRAEHLQRLNVTMDSPTPARIAALRGLRLGTTGAGAAPDSLFRWLLAQGGMDASRDVRLVPVQGGGPALLAALGQNVIDGFCLSSPTADLAVRRFGCAYLFDMALNPPEAMREHQYITASAHERTIASRRDALVRYTHGVALALRSIEREPARFREFALRWLELDPEIADRAFQSNGRIYFPDPRVRENLFRDNVEFINFVNRAQNEAPLPSAITYAASVEPGIAEEAMRRLGG